VAATLAVGLGGGVAIGEVVATVSTGSPFAAGHPGTSLAHSGSNPTSTLVPGAKTTGPTLSLPAKSLPVNSAQARESADLPPGLTYAPGSTNPLSVFAPLRVFGPVSSSTTAAPGLGSPVCAVNNCGIEYGGDYIFAPERLLPLFVRTANAITVRAFTAQYDVNNVSPQLRTLPQECAPRDVLVVEVSDAGAVGTITVPALSQATSRVAVAEDEVIGQFEGFPMVVVAVHVGAGIAAVEARFATGAFDDMKTVGGWGVLVARLPGPLASAYMQAAAHVAALTAGGDMVEQLTVRGPSIALPTGCLVALPTRTGGPERPQTGKASKAAPAG
jgi:hypothetical protein